jgi:hypothetical protein
MGTFGQHLKVPRKGYDHHGIGIEGGYVVHFTGVANGKAAARVQLDTLETFAEGAPVSAIQYARRFAPEEVVRRARSLLGRSGYNLINNNCEHLARWCMTGELRSAQMEKAGGSVLGVGGSAASATATAAGTVATASAAGTSGGAAVMSAIRSAGQLAGGGAARGVVVMAAAPAVVANVAIHRALPDDPNLPQSERAARRHGRQTTQAASILGGVGSVGAVAPAGEFGLSAVGISTGLAEIGALVGGGMLAGAAVVIAVPAAVAFIVGLLAYQRKARR